MATPASRSRRRGPARAACAFLFWLAGAAALPLRAAEIQVTDDTGADVTLRAPATRVVTLAPHLTELIYSVGAEDRLVATVESADYPQAATRVPRIGDSASIDFERLIALGPDLVLAWQSGNGGAVIEHIRELGLTVYVSEPGTPAQIARTLRAVGALTGRMEAGAAAAARFESRLATLGAQAPRGQPVRVFYQIWGQPLFTVGGQHVISRIIELCGGANVFADLPGYAGQVDVEAVLARDPDLIVASGHDAARPAWLDDWRRWPQLRAAKNGRLEFIPPDLIQRHSMRLLDGARMLCGMIKAAASDKGETTDDG